MGVVQNSIDIQKIIEAGGDPEIAAKVQELEAEIGDENSGIIKDIDDLQEANALIMTSVRSMDFELQQTKVKADNAVELLDSVDFVSYNLLDNQATSNSNFYGLEFTVNEDKSVTVTGGNTSTAVATFSLMPSSGYLEHPLPEGDYIVSDGGASIDHLYLFIARKLGAGGTAQYIGVFGEKEITVDYSVYDRYNFGIHFDDDFTVPAGGIKFNVMIKRKGVNHTNYMARLMSNKELAAAKLDTETLKSVTAAAADFAAFKTAIAAL